MNGERCEVVHFHLGTPGPIGNGPPAGSRGRETPWANFCSSGQVQVGLLARRSKLAECEGLPRSVRIPRISGLAVPERHRALTTHFEIPPCLPAAKPPMAETWPRIYLSARTLAVKCARKQICARLHGGPKTRGAAPETLPVAPQRASRSKDGRVIAKRRRGNPRACRRHGTDGRTLGRPSGRRLRLGGRNGSDIFACIRTYWSDELAPPSVRPAAACERRLRATGSVGAGPGIGRGVCIRTRGSPASPRHRPRSGAHACARSERQYHHGIRNILGQRRHP